MNMLISYGKSNLLRIRNHYEMGVDYVSVFGLSVSRKLMINTSIDGLLITYSPHEGFGGKLGE